MSKEIDDILLKSVSDKRWIKKIINESLSSKVLNNWNHSLKTIFLFLKDYFGTNYTYPTFYEYKGDILKLCTVDSGPTLHIIFDSSTTNEKEAFDNFLEDNITNFNAFDNNTDGYSSKIKKIIKIPEKKLKISNNYIINNNSSKYYFHGKFFKEITINLRSGIVDKEMGLLYYINKGSHISPSTIYDYILYDISEYEGKYHNKFELILNEIAPLIIKYYHLDNTSPMDILETFKLKYKNIYTSFFEYNDEEDENNSIVNNQEIQSKQIEIKTDANLDTTYNYESNTGGKKTKKQHQKSLRKYTVDIDNEPTEKDNVTMHILSKKSDKDDIRVLPFLYTNEVVTDERARTYVDVCNMVTSNVEKIEDNLYSENFGKTLVCRNSNIKKYIKGTNDDNKSPELGNFLDDREALGAKKLKVATASTQDKSQLRRISVRVCDCYLDAMKKSKEKDFTSNYEDSAGLNYNLHLYLVEILSALAVCACPKNCTWQEKTKNSGLPEFKKHVGVDENTSDFTNICYISFPEASNFPLADSVIYINGIRTYLSTKGGAKAEGANPSIKTLSEFVYGEDGKILTYLTDGIIKKYPNEFNIFLELLKGSVSSLNFDKINSSIGCSTLYDLENWLEMNKDIMTYIIMEILQAQSFQFMQAKCSATSSNNDFHFNYSIQYPAVFAGDVDILFEKGKIKFHIANQELQES